MNGKDINDVKDSLLTIRFAFPIPFTKTVAFFCTGRVNLKPHEHHPTDAPLEGQSREGASLARVQAARTLGVRLEDVAVGIGKVNVWIEWNGITWNAATWNKVLADIIFYSRKKKSRTVIGKEDYHRARTKREASIEHGRALGKKITGQDPGGQN